MTKIALFGSVMISAALSCGVAHAQANGAANDRPAYGDIYGDEDKSDGAPPEKVIVRPEYGQVQKQRLHGRVGGERDPTEYALPGAVNFADLDLSGEAGKRELRQRVYDTARGLCAEMDRQIGYNSDQDQEPECVRTAARNAMRDVTRRKLASAR